MCEWCRLPADGSAGYALAERPAQSLVGTFWEGTHAQAEAGATREILRRMQAFAGDLAGDDPWAGPIVGISWNDRPDGFRYFAGIESDQEAVGGLRRIEVPVARYVTDWHAEADGEVLDHYLSMLRWMETQGERWDKTHMHHREEYPLHADFSGPPVLRLMLPVG